MLNTAVYNPKACNGELSLEVQSRFITLYLKRELSIASFGIVAEQQGVGQLPAVDDVLICGRYRSVVFVAVLERVSVVRSCEKR